MKSIAFIIKKWLLILKSQKGKKISNLNLVVIRRILLRAEIANLLIGRVLVVKAGDEHLFLAVCGSAVLHVAMNSQL